MILVHKKRHADLQERRSRYWDEPVTSSVSGATPRCLVGAARRLNMAVELELPRL
jgi:hypothetical protein